MKKLLLATGNTMLYDDQDQMFVDMYTWSDSDGYAAYSNSRAGIYIKFHRLILGVTDSKILVDHRDTNGLNNQRGNLRVATHQQNQFNSTSTSPKKSSRHKGVSWCKQTSKWNANIMHNGIKVNLGRFKHEQDAALAYNVAALKYFGEFARLNEV